MTFFKYIIYCQIESDRLKSDLTAGSRAPDRAARRGFCTPNSVLQPARGGNRYIYILVSHYIYIIIIYTLRSSTAVQQKLTSHIVKTCIYVCVCLCLLYMFVFEVSTGGRPENVDIYKSACEVRIPTGDGGGCIFIYESRATQRDDQIYTVYMYAVLRYAYMCV